jgi:hypothetical protein
MDWCAIVIGVTIVLLLICSLVFTLYSDIVYKVGSGITALCVAYACFYYVRENECISDENMLKLGVGMRLMQNISRSSRGRRRY